MARLEDQRLVHLLNLLESGIIDQGRVSALEYLVCLLVLGMLPIAIHPLIG